MRVLDKDTLISRSVWSAGVLSSFPISDNFDLLTLESLIIKACFTQHYALYESWRALQHSKRCAKSKFSYPKLVVNSTAHYLVAFTVKFRR